MKTHLEPIDCVEGMGAMETESVDLVVTSPPYNRGIKYRSYVDRMNTSEYFSWCSGWMGEIHRLLKPGGSFFLNVGGMATDPDFPLTFLGIARHSWKFVHQNTIHWIKSVTVDGTSRGHFKPVNSSRFLNQCHEYIFHLTKSGSVPLDRLAAGVPYQDKSNVKRWAAAGGTDKRCGGNVWFMPYDTIQRREKDRPHPATFPVELPTRCIRLHGRPADRCMLDPFLGSGVSAVAAVRCGVREFHGFDIDRSYVADAKAAVAHAEATR